MEDRSQIEVAQPKPLWACLPQELRLTILETLESLVSGQRNHPMANLACVSKEWQAFFERLLWSTLKLRPSFPCSNFQGFRQFLKGPSCRTALIKKVALQIDLNEGVCGSYGGATTTAAMIKESMRTIATNLRVLFSILRWADLNATAGIILELGAVFPGDDDMHFPAERCRCAQGPRFTAGNGGVSHHNLEDSIFLETAPVITSLFIRESVPSGLLAWSITKIMNALPCLKQIGCERRLESEMPDLEQNHCANQLIIENKSYTQSAIRRLSVWVSGLQSQFEDRHDRFVDQLVNHDYRQVRRKSSRVILMTDVISASFHLEEMAISHALDARDFFQNFNSMVSMSSATVPLESLALTCQLEKLSIEPAEVEQLLVAASEAATYMPRLKIMEVWSPGLGKGFFFRYEVEESEAKLTLAATWSLKLLSAPIVESWQKAASRQENQRFLWSTESIDPNTLTRDDSICKHLRLFPFLRNWESN